jgi:hypothetical protein
MKTNYFDEIIKGIKKHEELIDTLESMSPYNAKSDEILISDLDNMEARR